jgi:hypothetical protein
LDWRFNAVHIGKYLSSQITQQTTIGVTPKSVDNFKKNSYTVDIINTQA